jgi:segregation and condensation protein B
MLYGTTRRFLEVFGLENLKNLPTLRELDEMAREQGLLERATEDALAPAIDSPTVEADAETEVAASEDSADDEASSIVEEDPEVVEGVDEIVGVDVDFDDSSDDIDEDPAER